VLVAIIFILKMYLFLQRLSRTTALTSKMNQQEAERALSKWFTGGQETEEGIENVCLVF